MPLTLLKRKVCDITHIELQRFINQWGKDASKSYINKMRSFLNLTFALAIENGVRRSNPTRELKYPDKQERPREVFTRDEILQIVSYAREYRQNESNESCKEDGKFVAYSILFMLFTGVRRGELLGLMWSDIDKAQGRIHLKRAVYIEDTGAPMVQDYKMKTEGSLRDIPCPNYLQSLLEELPRRGKYVFATKDGGIQNPHNFSRAFKRFFERMEKDTGFSKQLSTHACRHTFATEALKHGNLRAVQQALGHTQIVTTARYLHPDFEQKNVLSML